MPPLLFWGYRVPATPPTTPPSAVEAGRRLAFGLCQRHAGCANSLSVLIHAAKEGALQDERCHTHRGGQDAPGASARAPEVDGGRGRRQAHCSHLSELGDAGEGAGPVRRGVPVNKRCSARARNVAALLRVATRKGRPPTHARKSAQTWHADRRPRDAARRRAVDEESSHRCAATRGRENEKRHTNATASTARQN